MTIYNTVASILSIPIEAPLQVQRFQSMEESHAIAIDNLGFISTDDIEHIGDIVEANLYRTLHNTVIFARGDDALDIDAFVEYIEKYIEDNDHTSLAEFMIDVHTNRAMYIHPSSTADDAHINGLH